MKPLFSEIGKKKTKLTLDYFIPKNIVNEIWVSLTKKKKVEEAFAKSMQNFVGLVKEIKLPHVPQ